MNSSHSVPSEQPADETNASPLINWALRLVPAFIVGRAACMKFAGAAPALEMFEALHMEPGGRLLIAVIEALCVVLLLSPRLSGWGAILCLGVMSGAVIAHVTVLGFSGASGMLFVMALVSGVASVALLYRLRHQVPFIRNMFEQ